MKFQIIGTKQHNTENAMQEFINKYRDQINGTLSGFDRLVFRRSLRRLNYGYWDQGLQSVVAQGMEQYLWQNHIPFKDYLDHVKHVSQRVKQASVQPFLSQGLPVEFLRSPSVDKDEMARAIATKRSVESGLVCALSSVEPSPSFEHRGTHLVRRIKPCQVLYQYQIHPQVGWMYARIQTWFPFNIQVGLNGREWLARQMDQQGLKYRRQGNCFVWIEDYEQAQKLLNRQLETNWAELLNSLAERLNPVHESIFERYPASYYWTCYQSEWATDMVFREADFLRRLMPLLVRHGMLSYSSPDVMRYFGRRVNQSGDIPANFKGTLETDLKRRQEGERVKYRMNGNSAKFHDKAYSEIGSVLRGAETTINAVQDFRAYRSKEGGPEEDLQWRPPRKGIADLHRRAEVSQKANQRLLNALASVDDSRSVEELTAGMQKHTHWNGRRVRGLRPWAEDKELLTAVNHGEFPINGFRNRDLQKLLYTTQAESQVDRRRRSSAISRKLRLLRAHGLIQKVPRTHRYHVTEAGRAILVAVPTAARASVKQLNQFAKAA
ncbi:MAG: hypothetical protein M3Y27_11785 [Acidobacteriota bacterium]|nr:hypothetical protein [Acidobacteriota bacterium]